MDRGTAIGLLDQLHKAQNEFYAGGSGAALRDAISPPAAPGQQRRYQDPAHYEGVVEGRRFRREASVG